ncbi:uncharacterized protein LOC122044102 [Zingiber officinale]|uniref:uncharacterized protein LOC122044102 n=1 Tax=Zingiber officinale TaxID=94328 RepID=UPI001C4B7C85|nr:uncharacterized protein LOC122044102 [Zingiber officinale]
MVQQNQFGGGPHDDPNHRLELSYDICGTMKVNRVPPESVRLLLFRFSLKDRAKQWLNSLPANSISSWEQCEQKFLDKFYPPSKTAHMRNLITSFKQIDSESLFEAWDRFKTGGALMNKSLDEAEEIIENMAQNHHQWATERSGDSFSGNLIKVLEKFDVDTVTLMSAKLDALTKKFKVMGNNNNMANAIINQLGQYNAIVSYNQRQNNPYSNTYNPGRRNHPNFSYRNNQDQGPTKQNYQPGQQIYSPGQQSYSSGQQTYQQQQPSQLSRIEKMLEEALSEQKEMKNEIKLLTQRMENSEKHQKMQDNQIAQIAQSFSRGQGTFPRKPNINPVEHCNRIELRSGRTDMQSLHELAVSISWVWGHQRNQNGERRVTVSLKESAM